MAHPGEIAVVPGPELNEEISLSLTSDMLRSSANSPSPPSAPPHPFPAPDQSNVSPNQPRVSATAAASSTSPPRKGPPLKNSVHPTIENKTPINTDVNQNDGRIDDLLGMLECPICLDTADKSPIYQCPEGHLLCEDCNSRLVDCPQCGHALVNSRNRTAEELAEKLQSLRGSRREECLPSQLLAISVSEPFKVRKGMFSHVVYHISTKIGMLTSERNSDGVSYKVTRRYSEIVNLYNKLVADYQSGGIIVPPPPAKNRLAFVALKLSGKSDLNSSMASNIFDKRCLALDRYLKRLAKHPTIRKDPNFRAFIQEKELPKLLSKSKSFGEKMSDMKERISIFKTRFTVSEHDPWFQTRQTQLNTLANQVREMQANLKNMGELKAKLVATTNSFQRGLVSMTVSRQSKENNLGQIISEVVECHKTMGFIHQEQSKADDLIVELAIDYEKLIESAKDVMASRRKYQQQMQTVQKGKNPLEEIEKIQKEFDILSQTIRRELEHFDFVMRDEFQEIFSAYNYRYWHSLSKNMKGKTND